MDTEAREDTKSELDLGTSIRIDRKSTSTGTIIPRRRKSQGGNGITNTGDPGHRVEGTARKINIGRNTRVTEGNTSLERARSRIIIRGETATGGKTEINIKD